MLFLNSIMLSIIIPIFNEEKSIERVIPALQKVMQEAHVDFEIIAVNDGSKDRSLEILKKIPGIQVINHPENLGYGAALKTGIKNAKGEWLAITDADGTYPVGDLPRLFSATNHYDMVVGARTKKGAQIPLLRKPGKKIVNLWANFLTGKKIPDLNSGMRIFKKSLAEEFFHLFPSGFSFTTTITLACHANDYLVKYIPIDYFKREGKSTIHPLKDFLRFLILIFRIMLYFKPFRFFVLPSLFIIAAGFGWMIYNLVTTHNITDASLLLILAGAQIGFVGLIADLIAKSRKA